MRSTLVSGPLNVVKDPKQTNQTVSLEEIDIELVCKQSQSGFIRRSQYVSSDVETCLDWNLTDFSEHAST
jgi:hypothetical protein